MKRVRILLLVVFGLCCTTPGWAYMTSTEIRNNARFMTDRMSYELGLSGMQRNDVYEINYDFFYSVRDVMDDLADGYSYAIDRYYECLDLRNDDLSYVLTRRQFERFMNKEHFYRPLYVADRCCHIRIYMVYNNPTHFYFAAPLNFLTYVGIHSRAHFTHGYYCNRYHHARYTGAWIRPSRHVHYVHCRHHDFGPGIAGRPAHRPHHPSVHPVRPVRPSHPGVGHRPDVRPIHSGARPTVRPERPRPNRFDHPTENVRPGRPSMRPSQTERPSSTRPSVRPERPSRPSHHARPSERPSVRLERPSRPSHHARPSERPSVRSERPSSSDRNRNRPQRRENRSEQSRTYRV